MAKRYRLGIGRRLVNRLVRVLLALGWGPRHTYLLITRGRTTGRPRATPVTLVEQESERWLVAPYGEVGWVRNARAAGIVTLRRGHRSETVAIVELDRQAAAPVLKAYVARVPVTGPFFDAGVTSPLAVFRAEADRHPVFRIGGPPR
jgi:deazaflavin-dependent oxidoreductase (nitroreductase family)